MTTIKSIAVRGRPRAPMQELERARISVERGIEGDFRGTQQERQVTLLSTSAWQRACAEVGAELPWTTRRANLLLDGVEFDRSFVGKTVRIGTVELRVTGETDPCARMDEQCPGLTAALEPEWRGGICCNVVTGGIIETGDRVEFA